MYMQQHAREAPVRHGIRAACTASCLVT